MNFVEKDSYHSSPLPKVRGLFVGVEKYHDPHIRNLFNCREDAEEIHKMFLDGGERIQSPPLLDEQATRVKILGTLIEQMNLAENGDFFVIFVSTHGVLEYNDYFFFPHDASLTNILGTGISASLLINALGTLARKKEVRVLMIFDTCHSGAIGFDYSKLKGEISCLFSSSATELSYERFDEEEHGFFTKALLDGLRKHGDSVDKKGNVTLRSLFNFVYKEVQKHTDKLQNPILIGNMKDNTVIPLLGYLEEYQTYLRTSQTR